LDKFYQCGSQSTNRNQEKYPEKKFGLVYQEIDDCRNGSRLFRKSANFRDEGEGDVGDRKDGEEDHHAERDQRQHQPRQHRKPFPDLKLIISVFF